MTDTQYRTVNRGSRGAQVPQGIRTISVIVQCVAFVSALCFGDAIRAQTAPQIRIMQGKSDVQRLQTLATNLKVTETASRQAALNRGFKISFESAAGDLSVAGPGAEGAKFLAVLPVSYTHLTLPTKLSV